MEFRKLLIALFVIVGIGISCLALADESGKTQSIKRSDMDEMGDDVDAFKTRAARINAKPLDWDATRGTPKKIDPTSPDMMKSATGEPGNSSGSPPDPKANNEAKSSFPDDWKKNDEAESGDSKSSQGEGIDFGTKDVYAQYCENCSSVNYNYPQVAIGKLFSSSGSCSATVISKNNIIVTAAHCCYDRSESKWIGGWSFTPAYRDGYAPYGTFPWKSARILNRWISDGDRRSDVCLISLGKNSQSKDVTYYTGWLGRSWNYSSNQLHHAVGYPGNIGSGNKKELCVSESFSPGGSCGGSTVLNTGCSMTYGASGGPWIRSYRKSNWVNSVVSGYDDGTCTGSFGETFNGPRFTTENIVILCNDEGC